MDSIKKYDLCEEYIRYGARVTTAKLVSAITGSKAVQMHKSIHGEGSETGRDPQKWSNYLSRFHVAAATQKFLMAYRHVVGDRMFEDLDSEAVLQAYKVYAGMYMHDEFMINLTVAWSVARAIAQNEPEADVAFCERCANIYMPGKRVRKSCLLCVKAHEAASFKIS